MTQSFTSFVKIAVNVSSIYISSFQKLALYDKFGHLILGSEDEARRVLEYVVFENHIASIEGLWRLHDKVYPEWIKPKDLPRWNQNLVWHIEGGRLYLVYHPVLVIFMIFWAETCNLRSSFVECFVHRSGIHLKNSLTCTELEQKYLSVHHNAGSVFGSQAIVILTVVLLASVLHFQKRISFFSYLVALR